MYKKYNKIIADIDDTTQENRTKRMIAVLALEIADVLLEPESKCVISNSAMSRIKEIAAIPIKTEPEYQQLDWRDATGFIKICRDIVRNPTGEIESSKLE
jgi:hypothetical protein